MNIQELQTNAKAIVVNLARLAAKGAYKSITIVICCDIDMTETILRHIAQLQTATLCNDIAFPTRTFFKTASPMSLSASVAATIFKNVVKVNSDLTIPSVVHEVQQGEELRVRRARFLVSLVPILTAGGAFQCLALARTLVQNTSYFALLFQSKSFRHDIMSFASSKPSRAPELKPEAMNQLSELAAAPLGAQMFNNNALITE